PARTLRVTMECAGNGRGQTSPRYPSMPWVEEGVSTAEWTGVPLAQLLREAGLRSEARDLVFHGADRGFDRGVEHSFSRSLAPAEALAEDVLVAWAMNGEMLRPENGYPLRLVVPGVQGVSWVKYLRRIKVGDQPFATKDETVHYVDMMPDGQHRQYTSIQEVKSVITSPSGGQILVDRGFFNVTGIAWSGRGKIRRVDVSVDGGKNWKAARLETPILDKCLTRFNLDWTWDGGDAILMSRATDSTGQVQPGIGALRKVRGTRSIYHNNAIQSWLVSPNGEVGNVQIG
ncbi:MAG: molybdopterin-dependent oxidoreductase, partial [Burkholderiales bacterium]|nr:molybdopterin-dependent oxidoreductase [Burkholderiales bacterium]